jgi:hypothetical protein
MAFKTRVLDSSRTSQEFNQLKKCKLVLVDTHQGWLKHKCFAMHMMTWPVLVTIIPGVLQHDPESKRSLPSSTSSLVSYALEYGGALRKLGFLALMTWSNDLDASDPRGRALLI